MFVIVILFSAAVLFFAGFEQAGSSFSLFAERFTLREVAGVLAKTGRELVVVAAVLFDEFHERSLDADFGLALALDAQGGLREDLRAVDARRRRRNRRGRAAARLTPVERDHARIESQPRQYAVDRRFAHPFRARLGGKKLEMRGYLGPFAREPATSWATPHLAGIAARILSLKPDLFAQAMGSVKGIKPVDGPPPLPPPYWHHI